MSATSPVGERSLPAPVQAVFPRPLEEYRAILAKAWSDKTIHPGYLPFQPVVRSQGQCGVSSAWLLRRLGRRQRRLAEYCYGDIVVHGAQPETIRSHCWVEIGDASSADRLVVDLTRDQFGPRLPDTPLSESHGSLMKRSIEYRARRRMQFEDLREDAVWPRFKVLEQETLPAWRRPLHALARKATPLRFHRRRHSSDETSVAVRPTEAPAA